ncbi:MAG: acyltransferase family protein [Paracoccaceae bacterium]
MQYYLRFHLALLVVLDHLLPGYFSTIGTYAVCGFYVISGYVITKVLNERYWKLDNGFRKFWINRALRLFPTFFVASVCGFLLAALAPSVSDALGVGIVLPNSEDGAALLAKAGFDPEWWPAFYIPSFFLIGSQSPFVWESPIRFTPGSWSLNVEVYYYMILSLGVAGAAASRRFFGFSLVLLGAITANLFLGRLGMNYHGQGFDHLGVNDWMIFYKSFFGTTFFFALGSLCHFSGKLELRPPVAMVIVAATLTFPFVIASTMEMAIFLRLIFGLLVAACLLTFEDSTSNRAVRFLGELSYPMFLTHWFAAGLVLSLTPLVLNSPAFLIVSLMVAMLLSSGIVLWIEAPIRRVRARFRT